MNTPKTCLSRKRTYFLLLLFSFASAGIGFSKLNKSESVQTLCTNINTLYSQLHLSQSGLKRDVFEKAMTGWNALHDTMHMTDLLSIADLSQSSNAKRLYVIDIKNKKLLYQTYVSHGRNSGEEYASLFSNHPESYKTCLGFYLTGTPYQGKHGLSLQLKGLEAGINDLAEARAIVVHGAEYVSDTFIHRFGRLGRSLGCPAIPVELCQPIINTIKAGSCFFIYSPDAHYLVSSKLK